MGYASVAGLPVEAGLWAIVAALSVYAVVGSSPQLSVGPESTTALMTAASIGPLAAGDPDRYFALAAALSVMVAVVCVVAWIARLGFLADLLSKPVLVGYLAGVAVFMIVGQLDKLTGATVDGDSIFGEIRWFVRHYDEIHWPTVAVAASVLGFLLILRPHFRRVPLPLIAVVGAAIVVAVFSLDDRGIDVVGTVPGGLPSPRLPDVTVDDLRELLLPAVGMAIVAFSDNMLTARAFAAKSGTEISANQELVALGAANAASGVVAGFPVSSSASRTTIADSMGGTSQVCSLVAVAAVIVILLAGGSLLESFPAAALGAVVTYAAIQLVDVGGFRRLARFRSSELVLAVATTVAVLVFDVLYGVLAAVALSIIDLVHRVARPHDGVLGYVPGLAGMHDVEDYPDAQFVTGLVVYRYDSPLFFANADDFRRRALEALESADGPVDWLLLNAEANVEVDATALDALDGLRVELDRRGVLLAVARVKQELRELLEATGFLDRIGDDHVFMTLPTAVDAYAEWYEARYGAPPEGIEALTAQRRAT